MMRERIFKMVQKAGHEDKLSKFYNSFIVVVAVLSIVPLMFKPESPLAPILAGIDIVTVYLLFMDYVFRFMTHDFETKVYSWKAFVKYPFTPYAIIDLLSILPSLNILGPGFRLLRMMRIFKIFHYSKSFTYIANVFKKEWRTLWSVLVIALAYIFISALAMFSYEPETFESFFHALYWATTALTTVGYGDIYPKSMVGQFISMLSSLFGIAVIALPAGVVTAGFMNEITKAKEEQEAENKEIAENRFDEAILESGEQDISAIAEQAANSGTGEG